MEQARPTICLAMIVRNEAHVITRCLESVKPWITHWAISDTGSVDDTCVTIRKVMADLPGMLTHNPWQDFGHNRTLAMQQARKSGADYTLVIDADETLIVEDPSILTNLQHDAYRVEMRFPNISYPRVNFMRNDRAWRYVGVMHEYPQADPSAGEWLMDPSKIHMWTDGDGARGRSGTKNARDCAVLEHAVLDEPGNERYWFYLGQSLETCNRVDEAIAAYTRRAGMGGYVEEVYYAHFRAGMLEIMRHNWPEAQYHLLEAYQCQPTRAEPLYYLARGHQDRMQDHLALLYLEQATVLPKPISALFVEPSVYDWERWLHYAVSLHNVGNKDEAAEMAQRILAAGKAPAEYLPVMQRIAGEEVPSGQDASG